MNFVLVERKYKSKIYNNISLKAVLPGFIQPDFIIAFKTETKPDKEHFTVVTGDTHRAD